MSFRNFNLLGAWGVLLIGAWAGTAAVRIDDIQKLPSTAEVRFTKEAGFYYVLRRGDEPAAIGLVTELGLGSAAPGSLTDTNATNSARFYRVEKVPLSSLRDTDGDGISDAWELLHRHAGAALNGQDANEDHNGNGVADAIDAWREGLRQGAVRGRSVLGAGLYHSLAIRQDGTLWGWGDNSSGQLGSPAFTETNAPTQIGADTNWTAVAAAEMTSYGLKSDGTLWFWGLSSVGSVFVPTQIGTNNNWIGVPTGAAGRNPTALQADGSRWQFVGSVTNVQRFDTNEWLAAIDDTRSGHWAIKTDGTLWKGTTLADSTPAWSGIAFGSFHALALRLDGSLWSWGTGIGNAIDGQLGLGDLLPSTPTRVGTDTWTSVAAGAYQSVGIKSDGSLWWWGQNPGFVPLGDGMTRTNQPTQFGTNTGWVAVCAGVAHVLALHSDGMIWTFGFNQIGKLANGAVPLLKEPARIGTDTDWAALATGDLFSFGVKSNGTLWAWGANAYGSQGVGDFSYSYIPRQVAGSNWMAVSGGGDHSVGLQRDGSLWVWGKHFYGPIVAADQWTNAPTPLGTETNWVRISAGSRHSLAMKADRSLWAWGRNGRGELGNGSITIANAPALVTGFGLWTNFSAGFNSSLGVRGTGLYEWGAMVGGSGTPSFEAPQQVGGDFGWRQVANGKLHSSSSHALALKVNGTLWAWGASSRGQLGTNIAAFFPVQVEAETNWSHLAVGDLFSGALRTDGTLWMTGYNGFGNLGLGTRTDTNLFTRVGAGTNWVELAAGFGHVLGRQSDGTLWAWGDNSQGQCAQPALFEPAPVAGTNWGRLRL